MDLTYTQEQAAYRDEVQRFVSRTLAPLVESKYDLSVPLSREDIAALRADIISHPIATEAPLREDGRLDLICMGIFIEEVSKLNVAFGSLATALFFPVWDLGALLHGVQKKTYGHLFAPGEIVAIGMSEPNAGSNPSEIETTARRTADGWILHGSKLWTSQAHVAAGILVAARNSETGKVSLFMVDRDVQTYDVRPIDAIGWTGTAICEVSFDECVLPPEAELTPGAGGLRTALALVEEARIKIVFMAVGVAQAALDLAVEYAKTRTQFGRPIGQFQLVQGLLAEMAIDTEAARMLSYRVASQFMAGEPTRKSVSIAKAFATEAAVRVASKGIQVHGAMGLAKECAAERYFRDARMMTIPDGTTEIHKLTIGRELTGLNAFS